MFNLGEQDSQGRQKRIEHRGKYLRVSRTGGVALRGQLKAAGLTVTGNTKHGIRVSTRIARGTNVAMQNGRLRLRGRYGRGPTKLNLSKSGFSLSTKNGLGTFNWTNPNRSSAKIAGIQMRGKKAANLQMIYLAIMLLINLIKVSLLLLVWTFQLLIILTRALWTAAVALAAGTTDLARTVRARLRSRRGERLLKEAQGLRSLTEKHSLRQALEYAVTVWGRGRSHEDLGEGSGAAAGRGRSHEDLGEGGAAAGSGAAAAGSFGAGQLDRLVGPDKPRREARRMVAITSALAGRYALVAGRQEIGETLLALDEAARREGLRTRLQERLIDAYADRARPVVAPE